MALYLPMVRDSAGLWVQAMCWISIEAGIACVSLFFRHHANINSSSSFCQGPDIEDDVQMGVIPRRLGSHVGDGIQSITHTYILYNCIHIVSIYILILCII